MSLTFVSGYKHGEPINGVWQGWSSASLCRSLINEMRFAPAVERAANHAMLKSGDPRGTGGPLVYPKTVELRRRLLLEREDIRAAVIECVEGGNVVRIATLLGDNT